MALLKVASTIRPPKWLASGMSIDEILADYEDLERADILAVLAYAAQIAQVKSMSRLAA